MDYKVVVLFGTLIFWSILDRVEGSIISEEEKQKHSAILTAKINPGMNYVGTLTDGSFKHEDSDENFKKGHPFGTVPILRTTRKHLGRIKDPNAKALNYSIKYNGGVDFAGIILRNGGEGYIGAKASIALHKPTVGSHQWSGASIILENGDNQIQAGWVVHPDLYHDDKTRLYTYWTKDNYRSTGCYNTDCPGFVIVSDVYPLNYPFEQVSDPKYGVQVDVDISIEQRDVSRNWFLVVNDSTVGYWPQSLFANFGTAYTARWGGQVYSQPPSDESPPMGSGQFKGDNPYRTAYVKRVEVFFNDESYGPPPSKLIERIDSRCYLEGWDSYSSEEGFHFLYGGTGGKAGLTCV